MSPILALGMMLCVLFCGLAIDTGRMELLRTQMQNASDSAAIAAELESEQVPPGVGATYDWVLQGKNDAALNGFTDGQNGTTVTVAQNPSTGVYAGRYDAIQVVLTQQFRTIFMGALNGGIYTLTTKSVALVPPCAYFLGGQSLLYSASFQNASSSFIASCPAYFNYAVYTDYFSRVWGFGLIVSGSPAGLGGGWTSQQMENGYGGLPPTQAPTYNTPVITDPLLSYIPTQPTFNGSCYKTNYLILGILSPNLSPPPAGQAYCGTYNPVTKICTPGLTILTTGTVTLLPGLYVFTCGVSWNNATITGNGVTLYFTNPTQGSSVGYGQVLISAAGLGGAATLTLSAPTVASNGSLAGILFFLDRRWTTASLTSDQDFRLDTNTNFTGDGIWYAPHTGLYAWLGSFNFSNYGTFIVNDAYIFAGQLQPAGNFAWLSGGSPFRTQQVLVQ